MSHWITNSVFYHIYPIGFCGCERFSADISSASAVPRISKISDWIPHLRSMSVNAVYLGPVFHSVSHGYDTIDYKKIDPRLGTNEDFSAVCKALHENGIRIVLDGVFNHVGRDHPAFLDVRKNRDRSRYCGWFRGLNFGGNSPYNDGFGYEGWNGCYDLVKLNLDNPEVTDMLCDAVSYWIDEWDIDGIRFDAADCLTYDFIKKIHSLTRSKKSDFWLMGEIIHGNYKNWVNPDMFDSVTNYQCYKGIYSSHNDHNFFEIAHNIEYVSNQYGNLYLYNFLDNHDVARIATQLRNPEHIYCCYTLMFTMYGIPSIYYGSEFGIKGAKGKGELADAEIRPCLDLDDIPHRNERLLKHITALGSLRTRLEPLCTGSYSKMELKNSSFLYKREKDGEEVYIALNINDSDYTFNFGTKYARLADRLSGKQFNVSGGNASITVPANSSMVLVDDTMKTEVPVSESEPAPVPVTEPAPTPAPVSEPAPAPAPENANRTPSAGLPADRKIVIGGRYRHFKGGEYVVLGVARDHESFEEQVVYIQTHDKPITWVRPLKMFLEDVNDHGNIKPRFSLIDD